MDKSKLRYFFSRYKPFILAEVIRDPEFETDLFVRKNRVNTTTPFYKRDWITILLPYKLSDSRLKKIVDEFLTCDYVQNHGPNSVDIEVTDLSRFIQRFSNVSEIDWDFISSQKNFLVSRDVLLLYKDKFNWSQVSERLHEFNITQSDLAEVFDYINWDSLLTKSPYRFTGVEIDELIKNKKVNFDSLSSSHCILWSEDLIEKYVTKWNWWALSGNESVRWSEKRIYQFLQHIDFNCLSSNQNVEWSVELLEKFKDRWYWPNISVNPSIEWKYADLVKFEKNIIWVPQVHLGDRKELCFSCNTGFQWDLFFFEKLRSKIDPWFIARYGNVDENVIIKYPEEFDVVKKARQHFARVSDWHDSHPVYTSGWENFEANDQFKLTSKLYFALHKRSFKTKIFDGDAREGFTERTVDRAVFLSSFSFNDRVTFSFEELVQHYDQLHFLQNGIPQQVWKNIIKPALLNNEQYLNDFVEQIPEN